MVGLRVFEVVLDAGDVVEAGCFVVEAKTGTYSVEVAASGAMWGRPESIAPARLLRFRSFR